MGLSLPASSSVPSWNAACWVANERVKKKLEYFGIQFSIFSFEKGEVTVRVLEGMNTQHILRAKSHVRLTM